MTWSLGYNLALTYTDIYVYQMFISYFLWYCHVLLICRWPPILHQLGIASNNNSSINIIYSWLHCVSNCKSRYCELRGPLDTSSNANSMHVNDMTLCYQNEYMITMDVLAELWNCGWRMLRKCRKRFPQHRLQRKPLVSDSGMHHGKCVTHVPPCMSGSLTRGGGENVPGIPGAWATRNFAHLVRSPCTHVAS